MHIFYVYRFIRITNDQLSGSCIEINSRINNVDFGLQLCYLIMNHEL